METPILILAHQRPELLKRCLERLKSAGATQLFASVDGPSNPEQHRKVVELIQADVSPENVQLLSENLGCEKGVIAGIDWFFDQVDSGVIIEEDVLISDFGLSFLEEMLTSYRKDRKVFMAGAHLPTGEWNSTESHFFSKVGHIWGWATWKDRWEIHRRSSTSELLKTELIKDCFGHTRIAEHFQKNLTACEDGTLDTWDFQWNLSMMANGGLCALPNHNQIENIGISEHALHTKALHAAVCNQIQVSTPSKQPKTIERDREYEQEWFRRLKGEEHQLRTSSDAHLLNAKPFFEGTGSLVNTTDIGGGAERICFDQLKHSNQISKLLVVQKKSNESRVSGLPNPNGLLQKLLGESRDLIQQTKGSDVIHLHNIHGMDLSWNKLMQLADKKPIVWTLHDQWILGKNDHAPYSEGTIPPKKLAFINHPNVHLATPSLWLQDKVYWKTKKLPWLVKYGIDTSIFKPMDKALASNKCGVAADRKRILFLAKNPETNPYKNLSKLKKAWLNVNAHLGSNGFDLYCLGGPPRTEIHGDFKFKVLPPTSDSNEVASWINACDLSINSTLNDNSPVSILEALACKVPVIATNVGGINELLDSSDAGRLVPIENEQKLTNAILDFVENPAKTNAQIENGYRKIQQEHTIGDMCDAYLGLYRQICE